MKKQIIAILTAVLMLALLSVTVMAADTQSGTWGENLTWRYDGGTNTLTVSGVGDMESAEDFPDYPWYAYRNELRRVVIEDGITAVGDYAFAYYREIESVELPDSVIRIGDDAFPSCEGLTEIKLPKNLTEIGSYAFNGCEELTGVVFPDGLLVIGDYAFCLADLTEVTLPEGVVTVGNGAFAACEALETVYIPASVTELGIGVFDECAKMRMVTVAAGNPNYCTDDKGALYDREQTTLLYVPDGCEGVLTLPASVTELRDWALNGCNSIDAVEVETGNPLFANDSHGVLFNGEMTELIYAPGAMEGSYTVPEGTTRILRSGFGGCTGLTEVLLPDSLTWIGYEAFDGCTGLERVTLPDSVTLVESYAFRNCHGLKELTLSKGMKRIGSSGFINCTGLTEIVIPDSAESIGNSAFSGCSGLQYVYIPASVKAVYNMAFDDCTAITDVFYGGDEQAWQEIDFAAQNDYMRYAAIHYNADGIEAPTVTPTPVVTPKPVLVPMDDACGQYALQVTPYSAGDSALRPMESHNKGDQAYWAYSKSPICSYLSYENGMYMRAEYSGETVCVEWYDEGFVLRRQLEIPLELELFGGIYMGEEYNFIVSGQPNPDQREDLEVIRVTRYTKDWQREASVGLYGANTTIPFRAGVVRMALSGDVLYVHTAHQMYQASDGLNHQANLSFCVDVSDMTMIESHYKVSGDYGYISHSFNQFIIVDGEDVAALDHGDAIPRGLQISQYKGTAGEKLTDTNAYGTLLNLTEVEVFDIAANTGHYNYTGVQVGGFEASSTHYLVAGASCPQTGGIDQGNAQRNIFITATEKDRFSKVRTTTEYFTDYAEGDGVRICAPHLVKVDDDRFCLLWTAEETLYYCMLDGTGKRTTDVYCAAGSLSDCAPIVVGDSIVWYVSTMDYWVEGKNVDFYRIPLTAEAGHSVVTAEAVAPTCTESGLTAGQVCGKCGETVSEREVIPATGHSSQELAAEAPDCVGSGYTAGVGCSVCGAVLSGREIVPPLGHVFANGFCTVCGEEELPDNPFTDVNESDYFYKPVLWALGRGITGGIGEGLFGPDNGCTRGQVVMFLWRAAGSPAPNTTVNPFTDVGSSDYYYDAVLWAVENGITGGVGKGLFGPEQTCTRGQIVTFLWSAAGKPEPTAEANPFGDVEAADYYCPAVLWAVENDITGGIGSGRFGPENTCTRGQIATFLYKAYQ